MSAQIELEDFNKVEIRTGTIVTARPNPKARQPAYVLEIDFGVLGRKTSSAQLTENYMPNELVGKQIVAVVNFHIKHIAGVASEVLVLGAMSPTKGIVLLEPNLHVENGIEVA